MKNRLKYENGYSDIKVNTFMFY